MDSKRTLLGLRFGNGAVGRQATDAKRVTVLQLQPISLREALGGCVRVVRRALAF